MATFPLVNDLLIGLLSAVLATNSPAAVSNLVHEKTGLAINVPDKNDPVEVEFQKLMAEDDLAQEEMDRWIKEEQKFAATGAGLGSAELQARLKTRLEPVKKAYDTFLQRHPNHARAHLAYGSFLSDTGEEEAAQKEWEKGRELDPKNPAAWNNLANWYGHNGPVTKAFEYYAKAIELNPNEAIYYQNYATTVYLFRRDATNYFKRTEPEIFEMALLLYRKALSLEPNNFILATDYAQSYYGFKPPKTGNAETDAAAEKKHAREALAAWREALKLARDDIERQGVLIHFARIQINAGWLDEARQNLNSVTNQMFTSTKNALVKKLEKAAGKVPEPSTTNTTVQPKPNQ